MKTLALCWLIGLSFVSHAVMAQPETAPRRSVSYSTWLLEGDLVTARVVLPAAEAASLVGKTMPLLSTENLAKYVLGHVSVTAGGSACEATDQGYDIGTIDSLSLGANVFGFEIIFRCTKEGARSLHNAMLFAEAPRHVDFARVEKDGVHVAQLFTATRQDLSVPARGPLPSAGMSRFLLLGAGHVWHSVEFLCAMLGLFALVRERRELGVVIAALGGGYLASLLLVGEGLIPDVALLDSGMGFVLVCVAAVLVVRSMRQENMLRVPVITAACVIVLGILLCSIVAAGLRRPSAALVLCGFTVIAVALLARGSSLPIVMLPALAGFFDGMLLPGDYERLRRGGELAATNLAAFDAGALLMEALLLAVFACGSAFVLGRALRRRGAAQVLAPLGADIAASAFAGLGSFWLLSRLY